MGRGSSKSTSIGSYMANMGKKYGDDIAYTTPITIYKKDGTRINRSNYFTIPLNGRNMQINPKISNYDYSRKKFDLFEKGFSYKSRKKG